MTMLLVFAVLLALSGSSHGKLILFVELPVSRERNYTKKAPIDNERLEE